MTTRPITIALPDNPPAFELEKMELIPGAAVCPVAGLYKTLWPVGLVMKYGAGVVAAFIIGAVSCVASLSSVLSNEGPELGAGVGESG